MADRRKLTDSDIIADEKLLTRINAASDRPTWGSRYSVAAVMECLSDDENAIDVLLTGDRGLFLLH